jgi:hypothetical protein
MKSILKFTEFVNENLNEANLPSWVESGPYDNLKGMFAEDFEDDEYDGMTIADVDKNYKPALKYLGVKSIADMGFISNSANDDELYDIVDPQMKSSNFLGNDRGKGMNPTPYTGAYKGMLGDVKIIILQDINQENMYAYAAVDSRGNLK